MTHDQGAATVTAIESIAAALERIADELERLCMRQAEVTQTPLGDRPAIYEALRHIAINITEP